MLIYIRTELILKWESSVFKGCDALRVFSLTSQKEEKGEVTAGCTLGWTLPQRWAECTTVVEYASVSENFLSFPFLIWCSPTLMLLSRHILHLTITALPFLPALFLPRWQPHSSSAHGMSPLAVLTRSLLCHLSHGTGVNQAIKFETSQPLETWQSSSNTPTGN